MPTDCPYCSTNTPDLIDHIHSSHPEHAHREHHGVQTPPLVSPRRALPHLRALYHSTCLACGRREPEIRLTVDHVVPLSFGGTNSLDNLQPLCAECNRAKGARIVDYRLAYTF